MRLPDYHTHTAYCGHATGGPADYVMAAKAAGLSSVGVADHLPLLPFGDPALTMSIPMADLPAYVDEVQAAKHDFPGYVLLGVEADYRPHTVDGVRDLLASYPFDYVIGSVHFLEDWAFDDPRFVSEYADKDIDEVWLQYLELVGDAAESGLFTIMGHLDLVKKFGYRPTRALDKELDRLVGRLAAAGVLVEINTAGLYKPVGEAYPDPDILGRLNRAGVPVTFGSDAHRPQEVGRDFEFAAGLAQAAGYSHFASLKPVSDGGRAQILMHGLAEL
jgi:histidinol-phosphatase (PHP family)